MAAPSLKLSAAYRSKALRAYRDLWRWSAAVPANKFQRLGYADLGACRQAIRDAFAPEGGPGQRDWLHEQELELSLTKVYEILGYARTALVPKHRWPTDRPFSFASEGHSVVVSGGLDRNGARVGQATRIVYAPDGSRVSQTGVSLEAGGRAAPHIEREKKLDPADIRRHHEIVERFHFGGRYWKNGRYVGPHRQL